MRASMEFTKILTLIYMRYVDFLPKICIAVYLLTVPLNMGVQNILLLMKKKLLIVSTIYKIVKLDKF